jgi:nucleoside-diphosphate-sugar epimerase
MKILVIGGTGYIGPPIIDCLLAGGHEVAVFHRGITNKAFPSSVREFIGDRDQLPGYRREFGAFAPEVVIDVTPYVEKDAILVIETFTGLAKRVIAISSQDVYRNFGLLWKNEDSEPNMLPIDEGGALRSTLYPYRSQAEDENDFRFNYEKILLERLFINNSELPATILRLPAVYGVGDRKHRLYEYLKRMDDGRRFILLENSVATWRWTRGYIENIAAAAALACTDERAANKIYNLGEPDALTERDWASAVAEAAGWDGEIISMPAAMLPEQLKPKISFDHDLVVDTSRLRIELGFKENISRDSALKKTVEWERANPPLRITLEDFDYAAEDAALKAL